MEKSGGRSSSRPAAKILYISVGSILKYKTQMRLLRRLTTTLSSVQQF
ncbi:predicted protein [Sclerotinia sclerotiorum 1980 UF-70]|uniref:Uncharacterized protein n=1 Tax=Sclerotinia sclerotiorum (strain ATCC 18683 / 1980 / Ss-1) TaxID=665079 RepID=A7EZT3_SCLS1|nr:predicted protein [Sclerotinia sclerotiorum 1980 UF-70]EDN94975.1 predicted protein [Sclerotinia sclerotiorum 1980 UF-70]